MAGGLKDSPCIHLAINLWYGTEFFMNKPITLEHALATSNTFCKANIGMLETLASLAVPVQLQAQQHLFFAGDEARHFYWISNGSITLYSPSFVGENKIFRTLGPGSLVAETVMYATPSTYPLSAVAEQSCLLYRMPRYQLLTMTRQSPDFAFSLVEVMASRISQAVNRIDLLTITNSSQRLVSYLMEIYTQQGTAWLDLPASHSVIARQLNITPETFSRHLAQFKRCGLIGNGRGRGLVLLDPAGLCREVGLPPPDIQFLQKRPPAATSGALFECCNLI